MSPEQPVQPVAPTPRTPPPTPQPQPQPQAFPASVPTASAPSGSKGLAIASLSLGIASILLGIIIIGIPLAIVGIILGIMALVKKKAGKGIAIAGVITSALTLVLAPIFILIVLTTANGVNERAKEDDRILQQSKQQQQ